MSNEVIMWVTGTATSIGVILGTVFAVGRLLRPFKKRLESWINNWEQFMVDWAGEEERPGRDRIPGVMERLNDIDGELKHNGGSSIKDSVDRIEKRLIDGQNKFDELEDRIENLEDKLD